MSVRLCKIRLSVKDYATRQSGEFTYHGEVVDLDTVNQRYLYRFYETDYGTLQVEVDFHGESVCITEKSPAVNMTIRLAEKTYEKCIYKLDENSTLEFDTRTFGVKITEDEVVLDYDMYDPKDKERNHPLTRNVVEITCEGNKVC